MRPTLYYCDHHDIPLPDGHKFPIRKYRLIREILEASGRFELEPAPLASADTVRLIHDATYVERFLTGTLSAAAIRRIGFPWSQHLVNRTMCSVGGTLAAARRALTHGWSGVLAGGTHHAFRAEGSGFCVFNDVAIAIQSLRGEGLIRRAAIVDLDVHQGDGTAKIFERDRDVLTLSFHGRNNFPLRKQSSDIDREFDDGTGDDAYLTTLEIVLPHVDAHQPDIVFFQSGVDALDTDVLGKLSLTLEALRRRDEMVTGRFRPLVVTLGGGYSLPVERTAAAHARKRF